MPEATPKKRAAKKTAEPKPWKEGTERTQYLVKNGMRHPVKVTRASPPKVKTDYSDLPIAES